VSVTEADESGHPPDPATVYRITTKPAETALTTPEDALTVATDGFVLLQVPPMTDELNPAAAPEHNADGPLNTPGIGGAVTVTLLVWDASGQPPNPKTVYVMVVDPGETPVKTPVTESTTATPVFPLLHRPP